MEKMFFIIILLVMALVIGLFVAIEAKFSEARYDEMQELARGRGFKMGDTCMTFVLVGYIVYDYIAPRSAIRLDTPCFALLVVTMGYVVFEVYCAAKNAYSPLGHSSKLMAITDLLLCACSLFNFFVSLLDQSDYIVDGVLVFKEIYVQLSLGIAFGLTGIMLLIRLLMNKREQED